MPHYWTAGPETLLRPLSGWHGPRRGSLLPTAGSYLSSFSARNNCKYRVTFRGKPMIDPSKSNPVRNHYNALLADFEEAGLPARRLSVEARAYDDGAAFRLTKRSTSTCLWAASCPTGWWPYHSSRSGPAQASWLSPRRRPAVRGGCWKRASPRARTSRSRPPAVPIPCARPDAREVPQDQSVAFRPCGFTPARVITLQNISVALALSVPVNTLHKP